MSRQHLFTTDDAEAWRTFLSCSVSVFGSLEYAEIWQEFSGYRARLFVDESDQSSIAYPFFMRPIDTLPFSAPTAARSDIRTPDYTGPIVQRAGVSSTATGFAERFSRCCREQGIVAEFAHLHPWLACTELLEGGHLQLDREIVYVDLSLAEDQLWTESFSYACRKNIKRAQRERVTVYEGRTAEDVAEFHRIYIQTMERNQALDSYHFSSGFFTAFLERMPANARFVLAKYEDQVVAATLYLHDDDSVYSFLGGADHSFQQVRPTNAVVYDTIHWAKSRGKKRLVLGGGYQPNDGILRFKSSFSPLLARFYIYKRIHLPEEYGALCQAWSDYYHGDLDRDRYFPAYRSTMTAT